MESSFRLGRVAGVEVGANWSWLVVVGLIVWSLAAGVFPETNPGLGDGTYVAMAAVASLLFFTCLFLHELGHALQARRDGVEIVGITLWVFGGVARFKGMFPSAGAELRIALAGPAVTLVLAALLLAVALLVPLPSAVDGVVFWLGQINVTLLVFNMLPALPLDGGRVLRAALWRRSGDFARATRKAAAFGRAFGQFFIAAGLALVILGGVIGGVWLAFIGWFLLGAAEAEAAAAEAEHALEGVLVRDVAVRDPVSVPADLPLAAFMDDVFYRHRHTAYPVLEHEELVGMLSFRDVVRVPKAEWPARAVRDCMTPLSAVPVLDADAPLADVIQDLLGSPLKRAAVRDGSGGIGVLSATDALRVLEARGGTPAARP